MRRLFFSNNEHFDNNLENKLIKHYEQTKTDHRYWVLELEEYLKNKPLEKNQIATMIPWYSMQHIRKNRNANSLSYFIIPWTWEELEHRIKERTVNGNQVSEDEINKRKEWALTDIKSYINDDRLRDWVNLIINWQNKDNQPHIIAETIIKDLKEIVKLEASHLYKVLHWWSRMK